MKTIVISILTTLCIGPLILLSAAGAVVLVAVYFMFGIVAIAGSLFTLYWAYMMSVGTPGAVWNIGLSLLAVVLAFAAAALLNTILGKAGRFIFGSRPVKAVPQPKRLAPTYPVNQP